MERAFEAARIAALEEQVRDLQNALMEADSETRQRDIVLDALRALVREYRAQLTATTPHLIANGDEADDVPMNELPPDAAPGTPTEPLPGAVPATTDLATRDEETPTPSGYYAQQLAAALADPRNAALLAAIYRGTPPTGFQVFTVVQMDGSHEHHLLQGSDPHEMSRFYSMIRQRYFNGARTLIYFTEVYGAPHWQYFINLPSLLSNPPFANNGDHPPTQPLPGAVPSPTDLATDDEPTPTPSSAYLEQLAAAEAEQEPWHAAMIAAQYPGTPPPGFDVLTIIQMDGSHTHHLIQLVG